MIALGRQLRISDREDLFWRSLILEKVEEATRFKQDEIEFADIKR